MALPLRSPRQIACSKCRAQANTSCKQVKRGTKVQIEFLKDVHPERRDALHAILAVNPDATTDPTTHVAAA